MQKKVLLFISFILLPVLAFAQYDGGNYDGYAKGEGETEVFDQYTGGNYDGYAKGEGETEVFDQYTGGNYDGYAKGEGETEVFDQYTGGSSDGYAKGETAEGGSTLPIILSTFTAQFIENTPTLYWVTQSETDNMGWFVYRNEENDYTTSEKISEFIEGHGTTTQQQSYIYEDNIENPEVGDKYYYWLESIDYSGMVNHYDKVAVMQIPDIHNPDPQVAIPPKYGLQYGPNPFNSNLTVSYMLPKTDMVRIEIYNMYGQLIAKFNEGLKTADKKHTLEWDGKDMYGHDISSGVLLIKLITSEGSETKKAILLR